MLTDKQTSILKALINCIIPEDEFPNGWDAGVGDYIIQQFERDLKDQVPVYQAGLLALDAEAQVVYSRAFADISADEQTALLTQVEQGVVKANWTIDPASFFAMAVAHCTEGYYSNPENGGNRDEVAWQMIGFEVRS